MNSIESAKREFSSQISDLCNIHCNKVSDDIIFVGSGDSYVAGLISEILTDHKCKCYSPSDLLNSNFSDDKTYCFISVTGKTRANISAAQQAVRAGARTIAVSQNENSKLAQTCDEIIPLKITKAQMPTSGYRAFSANVVTCLQISGINVEQKFDEWQKNGIELSQEFAKSIVLPKTDVLHLLGNDILYAMSLYASFQMAEFFGTTVIPYKLEEFCHSPIFGIKRSHHLWILGQKEKAVSLRLKRLGLRTAYLDLHQSDRVSQLFQSIFFIQNLMIILAERYDFSEIQYLINKDVLNASSDLIYYT